MPRFIWARAAKKGPISPAGGSQIYQAHISLHALLPRAGAVVYCNTHNTVESPRSGLSPCPPPESETLSRICYFHRHFRFFLPPTTSPIRLPTVFFFFLRFFGELLARYNLRSQSWVLVRNLVAIVPLILSSSSFF